jgi:hypothetical protein
VTALLKRIKTYALTRRRQRRNHRRAASPGGRRPRRGLADDRSPHPVRTQINEALRGPLDDIEARVRERGAEVDRALNAAALTRAVADARVLRDVDGDTQQ